MKASKNSVSNMGQVLLKDMRSNRCNQTQYAELIGISRAHLNKIIRGVHIPTIKTIHKIADGTGISIDLLISKAIDR